MKKMLAILASAAVFTTIFDTVSAEEAIQKNVYKTVEFGKYEQDGDPFEQEPILWEVVKESGTRQLLVSKYSLDYRIYHEEGTSKENYNWEMSPLNIWLNTEFMEKAFTEEEIASIQVHPSIETVVGNETMTSSGKIYILSKGELQEYYTDLSCEPTFAAKAKGAEGDYWARDIYETNVYYPVYYAEDNAFGHKEGYKMCAVRPAVWVDFSLLGNKAESAAFENTEVIPEEGFETPEEKIARLEAILEENEIAH